jgi:hypothetical protein
VTCSPARIGSEDCRSERLRKRYLENIFVAAPGRTAQSHTVVSIIPKVVREIHPSVHGFIKFLPPPVISPWSIESTLAELISSLY